MKKMLFFSLIICLKCNHCFAVFQSAVNINEAITDAVYFDSSTCNGGFSINISTFPGYFSHVNITTGGVSGSWLQFFDAMAGTTSVKHLSKPIPADTTNTWWFKTAISSGITYSVDTSGGRTPCISIFYRYK